MSKVTKIEDYISISSCPKCGYEVFYVTIGDRIVGEIKSVICGNDECDYETPVYGYGVIKPSFIERVKNVFK